MHINFLYVGIDDEVSSLEALIKKHFIVRSLETGYYIFCGFWIELIEKENHFEIAFSQPNKISLIEEIKIRSRNQNEGVTRCEEKSFRSLLGALQWHANSTRPDLSFEVAQ